MLRFNLCHSATKAQQMKDRKIKIKKVKASIKDGLYLFICILILVNIFNRIDIKIQARGIQEVKASPQRVEVPVIKEVVTKAPDERVAKLKNFLISKKSPLAQYSELIISEADRWDIGWTKLVGISGIESAFATRLPQGSYNAWGLGGSKFMYFASWEESIKYTSWLLATSYKSNELHAIKAKYCPSADGCNPSWVFVVAKASNDILGIE